VPQLVLLVLREQPLLSISVLTLSMQVPEVQVGVVTCLLRVPVLVQASE